MRERSWWMPMLGAGMAVFAHLAQAADLDPALIPELQHAWADAYYSVPDDQKKARFAALSERAAVVVAQNPGRAEPLVWQGIILSSAAKFDGGPHALSLVKEARAALEAAEKIDPGALDGSVYTSLGSLYTNVPGWPLSFGNKDKAAEYLHKALEINPAGVDTNFFYAELLHQQGKDAEARMYLAKALAAPPRPGREDADAGRRRDMADLAKQIGS